MTILASKNTMPVCRSLELSVTVDIIRDDDIHWDSAAGAHTITDGLRYCFAAPPGLEPRVKVSVRLVSRLFSVKRSDVHLLFPRF